MNTLNDYIAEYIEYCEYRKRLDVKALKAYRIDACGYFFVNRLQHKLSDQSVRFMINRYAELAGISQHITPYMFRHSFATLLLEQDVVIRYIRKCLGTVLSVRRRSIRMFQIRSRRIS